MATDSKVRVRVVPEIDEEALRGAIVKVIAGHAVVKPGETLVIRCEGWNPEQAEYYQEDLDRRGLPFGVLVVTGDELAVAKAEPEVSLEARVAGIVPGEVEKALAREMAKAKAYVRSRPPAAFT